MTKRKARVLPWPHRLSQQIAKVQKTVQESTQVLEGVHRLEVRAVASLAQVNSKLQLQAEQIGEVVATAEHVERVMDVLVEMAVALRDGLTAAIASGDAKQLATVQAKANAHVERLREEWDQLTAMRKGNGTKRKTWPPRKST